MVSSTTLHLCTKFLMVLCIVTLAASSPRPHFGDLNPDGAKESLDFLDMPSTEDLNNEITDEAPASSKSALLNLEEFVLMKRLSNMKQSSRNFRRNALKKKLRNKNERGGLIPCFFNAVSCFGYY